MGHIDVAGITMILPDGRLLLDEVSFRVGDGAHAAMVGPNGAGKTTLMRIIAGDLEPFAGAITHSGGLGVMRQFIGGIRDESTIRDLLLGLAPPRVQEAAAKYQAAQQNLTEQPENEKIQMRFAQAISDWGDAGGYDMDVLWDICTTQAINIPFSECENRLVTTLSGGQQKRLALEALLRGPDEVLMLDEPDNYLDVPGKLWLEQQIKESPKTILLISHDRALLNVVADRIITVEDGRTWVHGGSFASYHEARKARYERQEEILRRWTEEHDRLKELVRTLQGQAKSSPDMASKYRAMQTRLRKFEEQGAPEAPPQDQNIKMTLRGSRTGVRVVTCEQVQIDGLLKPFDFEIFFGDRVAVLGPNGAGKSHLLRLFAETEADEIRVGKPWSGKKKIGARVVPGHFAQTHAHPDWVNRTPVEIINTVKPMLLNESIGILRKYELSKQSDQKFQTLSGGQQARLQILVLELAGCNLLLLDEPTDNLDLASAQALQDALDAFQGTVIAVTHDRWFADSFDRYLYVGADGVVRETTAPLWA